MADPNEPSRPESNPSDPTPDPNRSTGSSTDASKFEESAAAAARVAQDQAQRAHRYVMSFALPQRLMLLGSGAAFLLGFLTWFVIRAPSAIIYSQSGYLFWHSKVFFLTSLITVLLLTVAGVRSALLDRMPPDRRRLVFPTLTGTSLIFGPIFFWFTNARRRPSFSGWA